MTTTPTPAEIEGNQMNNKDRLAGEMNRSLAGSSVSPAEIEAFQKGLKLGLVPEGWVQRSHPFDSSKDRWTCLDWDSNEPGRMSVQAMEGLAGRELRGRGWYLDYDHDRGWWSLLDSCGLIDGLFYKPTEHLPALVDAVRRMRG